LGTKGKRGGKKKVACLKPTAVYENHDLFARGYGALVAFLFYSFLYLHFIFQFYLHGKRETLHCTTTYLGKLFFVSSWDWREEMDMFFCSFPKRLGLVIVFYEQ
jgi:hypothetical protein